MIQRGTVAAKILQSFINKVQDAILVIDSIKSKALNSRLLTIFYNKKGFDQTKLLLSKLGDCLAVKYYCKFLNIEMKLVFFL